MFLEVQHQLISHWTVTKQLNNKELFFFFHLKIRSFVWFSFLFIPFRTTCSHFNDLLLASSSSSSRLSHSTGYSSGSSSSSIDSHSTVLSAFSSRSNSSLSERSKTSPIPMKTNLFHYLPPINEIQHQLTSNIDEDLTLKDSSPLPSTSEQVKTNSKRKKFSSTIQVCHLSFFFFLLIDDFFRL